MKKLKFTVSNIQDSGQGKTFEFFVYQSSNPEDHKIEASFYQQWSPNHSVPMGNHYEVELFEPGKILNHPNGKLVHLHKTSRYKYFICWTEPVPDEQTLQKMIKTWCLGTFYTLVTGVDFALLYKEHSVDIHNFEWIETFMIEEYSFFITENI
jgi:hypothetical protein